MSRSSRLLVPTIGCVLILLALMAAPASAITFGQVDEAHENVGAILVDFPGYGIIQWCSGTLIHPRVFLTAGHCTVALEAYGIDPEDIWVSFSVYAFDKPWHRVQAYITHPDYWWGPTSDPHDLGVIILKKPVKGIEPASVAPVGFLDDLRSQGVLKGAKFAVVGYGVDENFEFDGLRKIAYSKFLNLHDAWLYMSQNNHTGDSGTCFGDSGGPTFWQQPDGTEVLVAVTSWGDVMCWATGINYRVDTESSHAFIEMVIGSL